MDVRIQNLEPGPGKFERRILILALRIMTLHSCLDIFQGFASGGTGGTPMSSVSPLITAVCPS